MGTSDQAALGGHLGGDWRMHLHEMRTVGALRAVRPESDAAERLPDRALSAAAQNPDHSEAGRAAAAAALAGRGGAVTPWRIRVPGFIQARDLERGEALFFGWQRALRRFAGALFLFSALGLAAYAAALSAQGSAISTTGAALAGAVLLASLLAWLLASLLRLKPARIAALHPAAPEALSAGLDRMLRGELGAYGHVVCLETHPADIRHAAGYRALGESLSRRFALNLRALVLGPVRTIGVSPAWRGLTWRLLSDSADAIVADLSSDAAASIEAVRAEAGRCVFVAIWGKLEEAEAALREAGLANACFHYAPDGEMQHRAEFRAALLAAMRATHAVSA